MFDSRGQRTRRPLRICLVMLFGREQGSHLKGDDFETICDKIGLL